MRLDAEKDSRAEGRSKPAGFVLLHERGKGSHTVWRHPNVADTITIAGKNGDDAQAYQEKQVREAIRMANGES